MSTIQNLKNFIRHGKQARAANAPHGDPTTNVSPIHAQQQRFDQHPQAGFHTAHTDPNMGAHAKPLQGAPVTGGDYSVANIDNRNIGAQAGGVAAKAAGDNQKIQNKGREAEIEQLVAEERQSKDKLPKYPGLERWQLVEKMGDGAFSNVYRAKDLTGHMGEVAIKVVRKFEMNSNQVCFTTRTGYFLSVSLPSMTHSAP